MAQSLKPHKSNRRIYSTTYPGSTRMHPSAIPKVPFQRIKRAANVPRIHSNDRRAEVVCSVFVLLACMLAGCSRMTYRLAADKEVKYLVEQKSNDDRWNLHSYTIGMDPRSRFFDPTDIDCPPMPYDDPA